MLPSFISWFKAKCMIATFISGYRFLKAMAIGAAHTWTSWLSTADTPKAVVLNLTGKRGIDGAPSLKWKAQGQAHKEYP